MQMLSSGFTVIRDLGNNGLYADSALRIAIEQGWLPGPTLINSGIIIGGIGGQFYPTPEMVKEHKSSTPNTSMRILLTKSLKPSGKTFCLAPKSSKSVSTASPIRILLMTSKLFIKEAANAGGLKVAGHVQTEEGARRAIEAGICPSNTTSH